MFAEGPDKTGFSFFMPQIPKNEIPHYKNIAKHKEKIAQIYDKSAERISVVANKIKFKGEVFNVNEYPYLTKQINHELELVHAEVYATVKNGIVESWGLSNKKNNLMVAEQVGEGAPDWMFDPNEKAMNQFIKRTEQGMNLSDKVWKGTGPYRPQLEADLGLGIMEGKSAAKIAKDIKQHLNNPDALFRRVKNAKGKLVLSKAAQAYHPGKGVYRSAYKNALRVSATENNMAYRTADFERWNDLPFVTGIEVRLSPQHPRPDICDNLKGKYPKTFLFRGWHPFCICHAVPIMLSDAEYNKMEDAILEGKKVQMPKSQAIKTTPEGFNEYVKKNKDKLKAMANKPYWVKDNVQHVSDAVKAPPPKVAKPKAPPKLTDNKVIKQLQKVYSGTKEDWLPLLQPMSLPEKETLMKTLIAEAKAKGIGKKKKPITMDSGIPLPPKGVPLPPPHTDYVQDIVPLGKNAKQIKHSGHKVYDPEVLRNSKELRWYYKEAAERNPDWVTHPDFKDLTLDEKIAIRSYTGNETYLEINRWLREGTKQYAHWEQTGFYEHYSNALDNALEKLPNWEGDVIRGLRIKHKDPAAFAKYRKYAETGEVFEEQQFSSSSNNGSDFAGTKWFIKVKTGKNVKKIAELQEGEILMNRRLRLRITKFEDIGEGVFWMEEV